MFFLCKKFIMRRFLSKLVFKLIGWKVVGDSLFPRKCLLISAPHTSNWDALIGRCYSYIIGQYPKYLIKNELFVPVLATLLRWNGGIPVYRDGKNNIVEQIVNIFDNNTHFQLAITPEGTRSRVEKWKTGFYQIALRTKVPLVLVGLDYKKKEVGKITEFMVTADFEKDMVFIEQQFAKLTGKIPENYNPKIY